MMDPLNREQLEGLMASDGGPHVSMILPAPDHLADARADSIRLTNFHREAAATLGSVWMSAREALDFLAPIERLTVDVEFFSGRRNGVAIYLSSDGMRVYRTTEDLEPRLSIGTTFCLRPMLSDIDPVSTFYLLTMSKSAVTLYTVTAESIVATEGADLPGSFEQTLADATADRGAQVHSASREGSRKQSAVFHGHGGMSDHPKIDFQQYLGRVDRAVGATVADPRRLLVLAGVDEVTALFRNLSDYPRLAATTISGNVDRLTPDQLFQRAVPIAVEDAAEQRELDAEMVKNPRTHRVSTELDETLGAAFEGRVVVLFAEQSCEAYGHFDPTTHASIRSDQQPSGAPDDPTRDLVEAALLQTLRHGGRVHAVADGEMPIEASIAALLRH